MASRNISLSGIHQPFKNVISFANRSVENAVSKAIEFMSELIPPLEIDIEESKKEIWKDLSALYFKYEDNYHKKAFREITQEISEKLNDGKWSQIYSKLYYIEQKD